MARALTFTLQQNELHGAFVRLQAQLNTEQDKGDIDLLLPMPSGLRNSILFWKNLSHST